MASMSMTLMLRTTEQDNMSQAPLSQDHSWRALNKRSGIWACGRGMLVVEACLWQRLVAEACLWQRIGVVGLGRGQRVHTRHGDTVVSSATLGNEKKRREERIVLFLLCVSIPGLKSCISTF